MTQSETDVILVLMVYATAVLCTLVMGYLGWLRLKSRYQGRYDHRRNEHRRGVSG